MDENIIQKGGKNEFSYILPTSKKEITFKFLTHRDEQKIEQELKGHKKLNKNFSPDLSTRMKYLLLSVEGDHEAKTIRNFVDTQLLARDARDLRNYISKIQPDVDLTFDYEEDNGDIKKVTIPIGIQFFWPDVEL
mgnify:FL=1